MESLLKLSVDNTIGAMLLAVFAMGCSLLVRRPALSHVLWLLVLVKLIAPPIWSIGVRLLARPAAASRHVDEAEPVVVNNEPSFLQTVQPEPQPTKQHHVVRDLLSHIPLPMLLFSIWLFGSACCAAIAIVRMRRFSRLLKFALPAPPAVAAQAERLAQQLALRGPPDVSLIPAAVSPMLIGIITKPRVLIPWRLWEELNPHQRDALLLHELAHLRRRDHWVRGIELLVTVLYWWNPLTWFARRQLRIHEELCCDAWVTWAMPGSGDQYAEALVQAIEFSSLARPTLPILASGVGEFRHLQRRLLMIRNGNHARKLGWTAVLASAAVLAIPLSLTLAQQKPAPQASKTPLATKPADTSAANHAIEETLNRTLPDLSFEDVGVGDVIDMVRTTMGANINDNWKLLEAAGFHRNAHITLKLIHPKGSDALQKVLDAASDPNHKLTYLVRDGVIDIVPTGGKSGATAALTATTRRLIEQAKYAEALAMVKKIIELDPQDEFAIGVQPLLEDKINSRQPENWRSLPTTVPATAENRAMQALLDRPLPEVNFEGVGLSDVIDFLRDVTGANIVVNWKSLEAAGVDRNAPVTLRVRNVIFNKVLSLVLENVTADSHRLAYTIDGGVISILARDPDAAKKAAEEHEADSKVQAQLDHLLPEVKFNSVAFKDAVDLLRNGSGAQIFVNWKALRAVGVEPTDPVTLHLRDVKLSKVLTLILKGVAPDIRLAYAVDGGVIAISTQSEFIKNTTTRVYDIRDIIDAAKGKKPQDVIDNLSRSIIDTVDTGSWRETGGNTGSLREVQGQLIITQTPDNHRQIMALIKKLRDAHNAETVK